MKIDPINIIYGQTYKNKAYRYLAHQLNIIDPKLNNLLGNLMILAFGIGDHKVSKKIPDGCIYMLVDIWGPYSNFTYLNKHDAISQFSHAHSYIIKQQYYRGSYLFDNLLTGHLYMYVLHLGNDKLLTKFIQGKYSEMYDVLPFREDSLQYKVAKKDRIMQYAFVNSLNNEYDVDMSVDDVEECDKKPILKQEIFNYPTKIL